MQDFIKLYLVEDHKIVRDGIRAMLLGNRQIKIEREFPKGVDFLNFLENEYVTAVVILDIGLPDISGIEIAKILTAKHEDLKIIILSANIDEQNVQEAVKAGVLGFLSKDCSKNDFIDAISSVNQHRQYFCSSVTKIMQVEYIKSLSAKKDTSHKELTEREIDVIRLLADGMSYKEIGDRLCISARTVETHRYNIIEKLQLKNNIDIVKYAIKNKIASL